MIGLRTTVFAACGACVTALSVAQAPLCVDPTFQAPFIRGAVGDVDFRANGQILVGGMLRRPGAIYDLAWSCLDPDGSIDPVFDQNIGTLGGVVRIWDDEYFFASAGGSPRRCFLATGTPDTAYKFPWPEFSTSSSYGFHIFPDEKQWRAGLFHKQLYDEEGNNIGSEQGYGLIQVLPDGRTDTTFDHKYVAPGRLTSLYEAPDGRFLIGAGNGTQYEGRPVGGILRTWPDGRLDTTFHTTLTSWGSVVENYYFYPDGRMLTFGNFLAPEYPGDTLQVLRLQPDGSIDASWPAIDFRYEAAFFSGFGSIMNFLEIEPGKLIVVGQFDHVDGVPVGCIAAIDTAGNVLWDYFSGSDVGEIQQHNSTERYLRGIERAPDGSIYIYGAFHGFEDGCSNHPGQKLITRLYPLDVGVNEPSPAPSASVMPNPNNGQFSLSYPVQPEAGLLELLDMQGRVVYQSRLAAWSQIHQVVLENAAAGTYQCRVSWRGRRANTRIVIE